jgi:hypothetical protein
MPDTVDVRKFGCIKDLRDDVVTKIKALNITNLGSNVYADRVSKICPEENGVCIVTTNNVTFKDNRSSPRFYIAEGDLVVLIYGRSFYEGETSGMSSDGDVFDFLYDAAEDVIEKLETDISVGPGKDVNRFYLKSCTNNFTEKECFRGVFAITFGFEFSIVFNRKSPAYEFLKAKNTLKAGSGDGNKIVFTTNVRQ